MSFLLYNKFFYIFEGCCEKEKKMEEKKKANRYFFALFSCFFSSLRIYRNCRQRSGTLHVIDYLIKKAKKLIKRLLNN